MHRLSYVDSHTAGEPTRVVLAGFPDLPGATLAEARDALARDFDHWRRAVTCEPRGHSVLVSALLLPPRTPDCAAGVIYFNTAGVLGMCGHGTIGLVATLAHLGRLAPGRHRLDTPVGVVGAELHPDGRVSVQNVPAYRHRKAVEVDVPGFGPMRGDVAWGGNWFFLMGAHGQRLSMDNLPALADFTARVEQALAAAGVTGAGGAPIDHVELFGPSETADSQNYVMCPGGAYDRSPCGTGTSAKLACLAADGALAPGHIWTQQSIIGSTFEASYTPLDDGRVTPTITGRAFVTAAGELLIDEADPFAWGL